MTGADVLMNIYPYMFTYGGPQLFVLFVIFVLTPIAYRLFLKLWPLRMRVTSVLGFWLVAVIVAYGDVFLIAMEAKRLCGEEAGMKIYRTMETEGILGYSSARDLQDHGIKYVESATSAGRPFLRTSIENGEYKEERINRFASQVELKGEEVPLSSSIVRQRNLLIERSNGSVLSEVVAFKFYPGWIDRRILGLLGVSWAPPRCDDDYVPKQGYIRNFNSDLVIKTINTQ